MTKQLTGHADDKTHDSYTYAVPGTETLIRDALDAAFRTPDDDA